MSHLERCYTNKGNKTKAYNDILALELYRYFLKYQIWQTSGELQPMTMAYQDLIEWKSKKGKPLCMVRIQDLRFEISTLSSSHQRVQEEKQQWPLGEW